MEIKINATKSINYFNDVKIYTLFVFKSSLYVKTSLDGAVRIGTSQPVLFSISSQVDVPSTVEVTI